MLAYFDEIDAFARGCFQAANAATPTIRFSANERYTKSAGEHRAEASYHIGNTPRFVDLDTSRGVGGWAVVLSVDLRKSSRRAVEIGPEDTYLTMHTYLPTMAELVSRSRGNVGSLRGDGLFAVFGFTEYEVGGDNTVPQEVGRDAIYSATRCGKAMIEATTDILNPILEENDIRGALEIGVGIAVGDVVVTQIGIGDAYERTLYGAPVNNACKAAVGQNEMILTKSAHSIYPTEKGGKVSFRRINLGGPLGGYVFEPPRDYIMLHQRRPRSNPR